MTKVQIGRISLLGKEGAIKKEPSGEDRSMCWPVMVSPGGQYSGHGST